MADLSQLSYPERIRQYQDSLDRINSYNPNLSPEDFDQVREGLQDRYFGDLSAEELSRWNHDKKMEWIDEEIGPELPRPQDDSFALSQEDIDRIEQERAEAQTTEESPTDGSADESAGGEDASPSAEEDTKAQNGDEDADCGGKGCGTADAPVDVGSLVWDFAVGVVEGALMAAATVVGLAALAAIPVVGAGLAALAAGGLVGMGLYGLWQLATDPNLRTTSALARLAGNFVGGIFGGWAAARGIGRIPGRKPDKIPDEDGQPKPDDGKPPPEDGQSPNPPEESPGGNKPPSRPPEDGEPAPKPRKPRGEEKFNPNSQPSHTKPSGEGKLSGKPEKTKSKDPDQIEDIRLQNKTTEDLANNHGYNVERLPKSKQEGVRNPDARVEGETFDVAAPRPDTSPHGIVRALDNKVTKGQAQRFAVNLDRNAASVESIFAEIAEANATRAAQGRPLILEVIIMRDGQIIGHFPPR